LLLDILKQVLTEGISTPQTVLWVISFIGVALLASLMVSRLGEMLLPSPKETRVADFLPFQALLDDGMTIECKDKTLVRVFSIKGADVTLASPEYRLNLLEAKKRFVEVFGELNVTARLITLREKAPQEKYLNFENKLLKEIATQWSSILHRVFVNRHYLILNVPDYKNNLKDLEQASQAIIAILDNYTVTPMYESETSTPEESPFYLLARMASPLSRPTPKIGKYFGLGLNSMLTSDYVHFTKEDGIVRFFAGNHEKLCITMGLKRPGDAMDENMVATLLAMDVELTVVHNYKPINKMNAMALLKQQQLQSRSISYSRSTDEQCERAMQILDSTGTDAETIGEYALTVFIYGTSREELDFGQAEVERICRSYGAAPVRESWVTQSTWFAQFPTYDIYPRVYRFLSSVVACAFCLERPTEGRNMSDWGEGPIALFRTALGTPYKWQFHVTEEKVAVGHAIVIGPTGLGKTTLLSFLGGQAMRHDNLKVYFFDRHRGVEIFTNAIGGSYIQFDGEENVTTLNPFACVDNAENRAFLRRWMRDITKNNDSVSEREIARAVTTSFDYLRPEERTMKNLYKSCFSPTGKMRSELFRWVNDDQYGRIFNSVDDNLDLKSNFMAFDFTNIFQDEELAPAVISYLMHRIHTVAALQGDPSLIIIDETAPMLKHPMFRESFIIGLQEGRKKRQAFMCAFQQPNIIDALNLGEVVRGQCQTVIMFRNPQAMPEDYDGWKLTQPEKDFIFGRSYRDLKYAALISRPIIGESVILNTDLSGLGPFLKLYSSGRKHVLLAKQLREELGPENYIKEYLRRG